MVGNFYVYAHLRADGTPFYVGKGVNRRAYTPRGRSAWWHRTVAKEFPGAALPTVSLLSTGLEEVAAFAIESFWIAVWGRRSITATGLLVNLTDGGEGASGSRMSPETKERVRAAQTGRRHTPAAKRKMSLAKQGARHPQWGKSGADTPMFGVRGTTNPRWGAKHSPASKLQMSVSSGAAPVLLVDPTGKRVLVQNRLAFAQEHGLSDSNLIAVINGRRRSHGGWTRAGEDLLTVRVR